jgi:hypothetical protein
VTNAAALGIGVGIGFAASVALSAWATWGGFTSARVRTRLSVTLVLWCLLPIVVAAFMPTFAAAIVVILGNAIGVALSYVVTLPMRSFAKDRKA